METTYAEYETDATNQTTEADALPVSEAETAPAATGRRKPAHETSLGINSVIVTTADGSKEFAVTSLPDTIRIELATRGLAMLLRGASDPAAVYARLEAGKLRREAQTQREPSHWDAAMVAAALEHTRKTTSPLSREAAKARVAALTREQRAALRSDPIVVKHHAELSGRTSALSALVPEVAA